MPELSSRDRLQPSLLDRLIDAAPQETREPAEARVLSRQQLRAAVLRDLTWLFNTTRPEPEPASDRAEEVAEWQRYPDARRSVLNFGMPAFAGITLSTLNTLAMENSIREAIRCFEPRIDPASLAVEVKVHGQNRYNTLHVVIQGLMWNQPVPLELLLAADVDMETGNTRVRDLRG